MALLDNLRIQCGKSVGAVLLAALLIGGLSPVRTHAQARLEPAVDAAPAETPAVGHFVRGQTQQPELVNLSVSAPNTSTTSGANFLIPVTCGNTTGLNVVSFQFDLIFDPAVIVPQVNPIQTFGTISDGMLPTFNVVGGNTLKVVFFTTTNRTGAGTLFYFKFTAVGPIGSHSPLTWVNYMWNEGNPGVTSTPGDVRIVGPTAAGASVSGRLLTAAGQPVGNCLLVMADPQGHRFIARSSPFGYFQFSEVPTGQTYVLSAEARSVSFTDRVLTLTGDMVGYDLTADP